MVKINEREYLNLSFVVSIGLINVNTENKWVPKPYIWAFYVQGKVYHSEGFESEADAQIWLEDLLRTADVPA